MDYLKEIPQFNHLNEKQQKFLLHYFTDSKKIARDAALKAGYSKSGAGPAATRLMKDNRVRMIMKVVSDKLISDYTKLRARIVAELASIAFSRLSDFIKWNNSRLEVADSDELSDENHVVVAEVTESFNMFGVSRKIKMHDKMAALKELNRMHGFYPDAEYQINVEGDVKQTTVIILPSNGREKKNE